MFHELRTTRSGWTPVEVCAPSRKFRWQGRRERRKFGFIATVQEEFETTPSFAETGTPTEPVPVTPAPAGGSPDYESHSPLSEFESNETSD